MLNTIGVSLLDVFPSKPSKTGPFVLLLVEQCPTKIMMSIQIKYYIVWWTNSAPSLYIERETDLFGKIWFHFWFMHHECLNFNSWLTELVCWDWCRLLISILLWLIPEYFTLALARQFYLSTGEPTVTSRVKQYIMLQYMKSTFS